MRTVKDLIGKEKKVYIFLKNRALCYRFLSDAEREGIVGGKIGRPTFMEPDDIFALNPDGTICYVGFVGRMYSASPEGVLRVDYERYISGEDYEITLEELKATKSNSW